ncbi:DUF4347 domain-containing protein, partial [Achromobacter sp. Marseille-Q0513]|uniref:DUF4347 domain-containing protein n=1 Tax=Achromobacter sp. Marseille-Q0513 TaxID=2829161 RepID=UPI001B9969EB
MTSNQRSLWNKVAPAVKRALLGARPDAAGLPAAARLPAARPLALEQRFMFDAAAVAATADAAHAARPEAAPPAEAQRADAARQADATPAAADVARTAMAADAPRREVAFVDSQVKDYQQLVAQLRPGTEVIVLDKTRDGLQQIADALRGRSGIDAIHIIGHGAEGSLRLGSVELNAAALGARQAQLTQIGAALTEQGDILLYGCDIGANAKGAELLSRLAQLTHADVAASKDRTGAAAQGGNWTLEAASGSIETTALSFVYNGLLAAPPSQDFDIWNQPPNNTGSLTIAGVRYTTNGSAIMDVTNALSYFGETFTGFTGNVLLSNMGGTTGTGATYLEFSSLDLANNFALKSLTINAFDGPSGFAQKFVIAGYDGGSGTTALIEINIDLRTSGTYGTGDWAITYTKGSSTYNAGTLVFGSAWGNLDTVRFTANDGAKSASLALDSITLGTPVVTNPPPVVTPSAGSSSYSNGSGLPVPVDANLTLTDADSPTLTKATVSLTGGTFRSGEDVLAFTNTNSALYGNIVGSWNASTGVLTLTSAGGIATVAQWEAALRTVTYRDSSLAPNQGDRTITFVVNDGTSDSSPVNKTMQVLPNNQPVIGNLNGDAVTYTEKGSPVRLDAGASVTLTDSDTPNYNGGNLNVQMVNNTRANQDVLGIDARGHNSLSNGM